MRATQRPEETPRLRVGQLALAGAAVLYLLLLLVSNLAGPTGLHGDEAWLGLHGLKIQKQGLFSLHGMNSYTGSFYSGMLATVFRSFGASVESLRLPGALANFVGILLLAYNARRWAGWRGFWAFVALFLASPGLIVLARVAWEVTAFHLLLVAVKVVLVSRLVYRGSLSPVLVVVFFAATSFGTLNHFLFISDAVALFASSVILWVLAADRPRGWTASGSSGEGDSEVVYRLLLLSVLAMAGCGYLFLVKPMLADGFFQQHRLSSSLALALPVVGCSLAYWKLPHHRIQVALRRAAETVPPAVAALARRSDREKLVACVIAAIPLAFLAPYSAVFLGTVTGLLPLQRTLAIRIGDVPALFLQLFWVGLLVLFGGALLRALAEHRRLEGLALRKTLFLVYPPVAVAVLVLFLSRTSTRHFLIATSLFVGLVPLLVDELLRPVARSRVGIGLLGLALGCQLLVGQGLLLRSLFSDLPQRPSVVRYPGFEDKSWHFLRQDELFRHLKARGICPARSTTNYILDPWRFLHAADPYACEVPRRPEIEYCLTCEDPIPFYRFKEDR